MEAQTNVQAEVVRVITIGIRIILPGDRAIERGEAVEEIGGAERGLDVGAVVIGLVVVALVIFVTPGDIEARTPALGPLGVDCTSEAIAPDVVILLVAKL